MSDENRGDAGEGDIEASFDAAWDALAGKSPKRMAVTLDVSLDLSDGRDLHEHLARLSELLVASGVIVSATSISAGLPLQAHADGDWVTTSATVTYIEQGLTGSTEAEQGANSGPPAPTPTDAGLGLLSASARGHKPLNAMMLSPEYERAIAASISPGSDRVNSDLGSMLADHINRTLRDLGESDSPPLLLLPPSLASAVRPFLTDEVPGLRVHGYDEIETGVQIDCVATLRCPVPPYDMPREAPLLPAVEVSPEDMGDGADWNW